MLDSSAACYTGLTWRKDSADLAVLRAKDDDHREGSTQSALAWQRLGEAGESRRLYDPTVDQKFPAGMRTVGFRRPTWSQDGAIVFLGIARWREKPASEKKSADNSKAPETKRDDSERRRGALEC